MGRLSWVKKLTPAQHFETSEEDETEEAIEVSANDSRTNTNNLHVHTQGKLRRVCYQHGRNVEELAFEEWVMMQINHDGGIVKENCFEWRIWPAHLELLRFLVDADGIINDEANNFGENIRRRKSSIPSPFCFRSMSNRTRREKDEASVLAGNASVGGQIFGGGVSLLASYPRSGNTLLRTLLERITSTVTGSDTRPDRTLSRSLALDHNLVGEGLVGPSNQTNTKSKSPPSLRSIIYQSVFDPQVHIVKTHFPERKGWKPIEGNRVLLLIRNPYDAIDSYWNLCCTNTHTRTLDESVYIKYAEKFESLAKHEIKIWCDFHYYWIDICEKQGVPLLMVRYEDLVLDTETEMIRIMQFLLGQNNGVEDGKLSSFWEWRIRHAIRKPTGRPTGTKIATNNSQTKANTSTLGSYQPRSANGGLLSIGKSIRKERYSTRVLLHMHEVAVSLELDRKQNSKEDINRPHRTLLQRFGYDIYTQQFPDNFKEPPTTISEQDGSRIKNGSVFINKTIEIRSKDDPCGRVMTHWRRGETMGDTEPFPTIPR